MDGSKKRLFAIVLIVILVTSILTMWFLLSSFDSGKIRVACVGDSITEDYVYPELRDLFGSNYSVGNFGVGLASVNLQSQKPYINQTVFTQAKAFSPNIVIIMLGTNDAITSYQELTNNFAENYKTLISAFQNLSTKPALYLVAPPPIFDDNLGPNGTILSQEIVPQIRQIANETGLVLIDVYSELTGSRDYFRQDGVHPNEAGSKIIANLIFNSIRQ